MAKPSTLQQRFEESRVGKIVISIFVALFVLVGIVWNLPESPIQRGLVTVMAPVAAPVGLDQNWAMYAWQKKRVDTIEVHVRLASGETRVWTLQPGERGVGWWDRWIMMRTYTMADASFRPQLARWVVREVTEPADHPVAVAVVLRSQNLSKPGEDDGEGKSATKVLYQETLAGRQ